MTPSVDPTRPVRLLYVQASPKPDSVTRLLAQELLDRIGQLSTVELEITVLDLSTQAPRPLTAPAMSGMYLPPERRTAEEHAAVEAEFVAAVEQLRRADVVVISSPMHNFGVSTQLKAWIDHVVLPGVSFRYVDGRSVGLLPDRPVAVVTASGDTYTGELAGADFHRPYLRHILGFIGLHDVRFVDASGVAFAPEVALASARTQLEDVAASITAAIVTSTAPTASTASTASTAA